MQTKSSRQKGAALITVMLVIALVSVIAVNLGSKLQMQITRMGNLQQAEQSYWMWLSAEDVLKEALKRELNENDGVANNRQYKVLLQSVELDEYQAQGLTDSLVDWIDGDTQLSGSNGAEDPDYQGLPKPYLAANSLLIFKRIHVNH